MESSLKISLTLALLFALPACDKQPATNTGGSTSAPAQAVPFKGEVYRTIAEREVVLEVGPIKATATKPDSKREVITLISADELEHQKGEFNLVCKYTKQGDTLRVIENMMGTTQAVYYKIIPQGLRANDGTVFYSPAAAKALEDSQSAK